MPGTPRTWTEDYPEETPEQGRPQTQTAAEKILPQVMRLILEVLRGHGDLLARFNAGLVPIRQGILTST